MTRIEESLASLEFCATKLNALVVLVQVLGICITTRLAPISNPSGEDGGEMGVSLETADQQKNTSARKAKEFHVPRQVIQALSGSIC